MADVKELWLAVGLGFPLLLFAWVYFYSLSKQIIRKGGTRVPPGRFWQLPFVGESIQFLNGSSDAFMLPHLSKYGTTFRTHLLGSPSICTTTVDAAKFVLQSPELFKASYSASMAELLGKGSINRVEGDLHARHRKIIQAPIMSGALKNFIGTVDKLAIQFSEDNGEQAVIHNSHNQFLRFTLLVALRFCIEDAEVDGSKANEFVSLFRTLESGFVALPLNLPGTTFNKALKARNQIKKILHQHIRKRRQEMGSVLHNDMLEAFLDSAGADGSNLSDEDVADSIMFVLVAAHGSTASVMVWAVLNLCLYPKILEVVKAENDALARQRNHVDDPITWEDLKKLAFTNKFLQETLRTSNVVALTWREATQDVVYNGMVFPKGWRLFVWHKYFHLDPEVYKNPQEFNPSRFETQPKINTFTPFGNGYRACPGRELAMQEMLVFMHRFLTTYDFEAIGDLHTLTYWAIPLPKDRLPLKITRRSIDHLPTQNLVA